MTTPFLTTEGLRSTGWTRTSIDAALADGQLTLLRRGLFSALGAEESSRPKILAGREVCSEEAVISHWSAAWLHDLPVSLDHMKRVHVTRSRRSGARISPDLKLYACPIRDGDALMIGDLTVTTAARTIVDISRHDDLQGWALAAGDRALRLGLTDPAELEEQLRRATLRPWVRRARQLVGLLDGRAESAGESRSRWIMFQAGMPTPDLQVEVPIHGGRETAEVDFLWADYGVVGEFDGDIKYTELAPGSDAWQAWKAEKRRHEALQAEGWVVARWTWDELNNPVALTAKLRNAFMSARRLRERASRAS